MPIVGIQLQIHPCMPVKPQALQINILPDIVKLGPGRRQFRLALRIHVAQYPGKLDKGRLRLVRPRQHQGIKRIERIKQEMRINLRLIERQLGLVFFSLYGLPLQDLPEKFERQLNGQRKTGNHQKKEPDGLRAHPPPAQNVTGRRGEIGHSHRHGYQHQHQESNLSPLTLHEHTGQFKIAVHKIKGVHVNDKCNQEPRIMFHPAVNRKHHDCKRNNHQTEQQINVERNMMVFHFQKRTFIFIWAKIQHFAGRVHRLAVCSSPHKGCSSPLVLFFHSLYVSLYSKNCAGPFPALTRCFSFSVYTAYEK